MRRRIRERQGTPAPPPPAVAIPPDRWVDVVPGCKVGASVRNLLPRACAMSACDGGSMAGLVLAQHTRPPTHSHMTIKQFARSPRGAGLGQKERLDTQKSYRRQPCHTGACSGSLEARPWGERASIVWTLSNDRRSTGNRARRASRLARLSRLHACCTDLLRAAGRAGGPRGRVPSPPAGAPDATGRLGPALLERRASRCAQNAPSTAQRASAMRHVEWAAPGAPSLGTRARPLTLLACLALPLAARLGLGWVEKPSVAHAVLRLSLVVSRCATPPPSRTTASLPACRAADSRAAARLPLRRWGYRTPRTARAARVAHGVSAAAADLFVVRLARVHVRARASVRGGC